MPRTPREALKNKSVLGNIKALGILALIIFLDQYSKFLALKNLPVAGPKDLIGGIFRLNLTFNTGAAFGILKNQTIFFVIISLVASVFIISNILKSRSDKQAIALLFILGGALGNLIDRLRFGYVVDFLDLKFFTVFNLADTAITIGAAIFIMSSILSSKNEKI
jgi:signal peptidase II